jgi:hypothetical protein
LGDVFDIVKSDMEDMCAVLPKKAREHFDAPRRVHIQLGQIGVEDA